MVQHDTSVLPFTIHLLFLQAAAVFTDVTNEIETLTQGPTGPEHVEDSTSCICLPISHVLSMLSFRREGKRVSSDCKGCSIFPSCHRRLWFESHAMIQQDRDELKAGVCSCISIIPLFLIFTQASPAPLFSKEWDFPDWAEEAYIRQENNWNSWPEISRIACDRKIAVPQASDTVSTSEYLYYIWSFEYPWLFPDYSYSFFLLIAPVPSSSSFKLPP